jgi:hypothetical protein
VRCEECLPLIEEYVDGELDGRVVERLAAHLSTCAGCAGELSELKREQEIYARYRRDVEVTPAQWNIVRARIEQEKESLPQTPRSRTREWFKGAFSPRKHFRPAFITALALLVVGIIAGIIYLNSRTRQSEVVVKPAERNEPQPPDEVKQASLPNQANDNKTVASDTNPEKNNPNRVTLTVANNVAQRKNTAELPRSRRNAMLLVRVAPGVFGSGSDARANNNGDPNAGAQGRFEEAVADRASTVTGVRTSAPEAAGDFDFEIARHAERAELLLRSFRNVRTPATTRALDVSYEKEQSRKLLYQNIALRQDAAARGDRPAAELLNTLEPILLDIANLPDKANARDVRSIEQRMEKKEIVAALQVRRLLASN